MTAGRRSAAVRRAVPGPVLLGWSVPLGWGAAVLALALSVAGLVLRASDARLAPDRAELYLADVWVSVLGPVVGAVVLAREPRSGVGAVLMTTAAIPLGWAAGHWASAAGAGGAGLPGAAAAAWLSTWTWVPYLIVPALVLLLGEEGPPRPRWLVRLVVVDAAVLLGLSAVHPGAFDTFPGVRNPLGLEPLPWLAPALSAVAALTVVVVVPLCLWVAVLHWHRAAGPARTRWACFAAGGTALVASSLVPVTAQPQQDVVSAAGWTALLAGVAAGCRASARAATAAREEQDRARARKQERSRLHRDLHDQVGPELAGLGLQLAALSSAVADAAVRTQLDRLRARVSAAVTEVRRVAEDDPGDGPDTPDLAVALRALAEHLSTPATRCVVEATPLPPLPRALEVAAYRIAAEAMTNAVRHAGATRCRVLLAGGPGAQLLVEVADDGVGLPAPAPVGVRRGLGLASMGARAREVGGRLEVTGSGGGTVVRAQLGVGP